jgi:nicotinate-nucleotide adenylyltransferase
MTDCPQPPRGELPVQALEPNGGEEGWITVGRPGFVRHGRKRRGRKLDTALGEGNWRICHSWQGQMIERDEALQLYEEAYFEFLRNSPEILDWLCATASEVYDIEPSNVESGLDYFVQESKATRLQDISVRRCLKRLGREFGGDHLVQIRGHNSEGYCLNPGKVPFHDPESIVKPSLAHNAWWDENSIEDFWQSNKILQAASTVPESALKGHCMKSLPPTGRRGADIAIFGGSFNPIHLGHLRLAQDLVDQFGFAKVIFVPNGSKYPKRGLIDERHRAAMVRLAVEGVPQFEVCEHELNREERVCTLQTLEFLRRRSAEEHDRAQLWLLRGSDIIRRMLRWRTLPELLRCRVLVPVRPGNDPWAEFGAEPLFRLHCDSFRVMQRDCLDSLSSSAVRDRVAKGHSIRWMVPPAIDQYIQDNKLYV